MTSLFLFVRTGDELSTVFLPIIPRVLQFFIEHEASLLKSTITNKTKTNSKSLSKLTKNLLQHRTDIYRPYWIFVFLVLDWNYMEVNAGNLFKC